MIELLFLVLSTRLMKPLLVDFHCHSYCSDGELSPYELIKLAEKKNIKVLAITDHDTIDAYKDLPATKIKIIPGIELSTTWNKIGIHIIGLNFDLNSKPLHKAIKLQKQARKQRAKTIAERLEKFGLKNAYEKLQDKDYIGRPDFAKLLIEEGICKDFQQAFKKFLGSGKIGDVKNQWLSFEEVLSVIKNAGGIPVLAHPLCYKLTNAKLKRLVADFKHNGGKAIEVINGYQNINKTEYLTQLCQDFDMQASIGSDYHNQLGWNRLGVEAKLVDNLISF